MATRTIKEIHEEVFQFLLEKHQLDNELRFTLRSSNSNGRLEEGYWFDGSDSLLIITFWNAFNDSTIVPIIAFSIHLDNTCFINIMMSKKNKTEFIEKNIVPATGLTESIDKNSLLNFWMKTYPIENTILANLELFLTTDKVIIDNLIKANNKTDLFPPIEEKEFQKSLEIIDKWRNSKINIDLNMLLNSTIKLQNIQLKNITHFSDFNVNLNKQVTCLIGFNGSGKSTILRAIAMGLVGIEALKKEFSDKTLELERFLTIEKANEEGIKFANRGTIKLLYSIDKFGLDNLVSNEILFRYSEMSRQNVEIEDNPNEDIYRLVPSFLLNEPDDNYFLKYLVVGFSQQAKSFNNDIPRSKTNGKRKSRPNIEDVSALIFDEPDNRFNDFQSWIIGLISVEKYPVFKQRVANRVLVNGILKVISDITNDDIRLTNSPDDAFIRTKRHPEGIPLTQMSQGYRNVIGWVGYFMKRLWEYGQWILPTTDFKQLPTICLIDEIDTYLHPDWQYTILSGLVEAFPNTQFIITSHSPYVLTSIKPEKLAIYELYTEGSKMAIKQVDENLYLADVNRSTVAMSGSERFRNAKKDVAQDIDTLFDLIESNQLTEAKAFYEAKLSDIDDQLDADIVKIKRLIRTKEALNKAKSTLINHEIN